MSKEVPPLHKAQQALVPHHRQLPLLLLEAEKVVHQGIHHPVQHTQPEEPILDRTTWLLPDKARAQALSNPECTELPKTQPFL